MLFNSALFFAFFAVFFGLYWSNRKNLRLQNSLVLAASYIFYGWWDERFLILIALSTACDYICGLGTAGPRFDRKHLMKAGGLLAAVTLVATLPSISTSWPFLIAGLAAIPAGYGIIRGIEQLSGPHRRKAYLTFSIVLNLGLLGVFKYFGFFTDSFIQAFNSIGFTVNAPLVSIILPVGISFYTFQTLSYTIDIYRKQMTPTEQLIDFAAYVAFFPQLVAGPIERAKNLLPQFEKHRVWNSNDISSGTLLFIWGLFKKIVIADNLAPLANTAFASPAEVSPSLMLIGILAFSFQIYCDFSGYSDMARGLARMIGFKLMLNFNLPYFSRTPSEFWRRWHISLSSWLRDYLYIPLGGNRGSNWLTYRNLALTMLLGGLWHGAAWTFIAWGAFHGAILCIYRALQLDRVVFAHPLFSRKGLPVHVSAWLVMSGLTLIGWTFFRAESIGDAMTAITLMGEAFWSGAVVSQLAVTPEWGTLGFYVLPLILVQIVQARSGQLEFLHVSLIGNMTAKPWLRFAGANALLFVICAIAFLASEGGQEFLYFDF
jgi:D-alanyl-lipoteichoic acid acyltransferase DltB (MBOAT superfamily)